ncbi:MAG: hypothetical protein WA461_12785 [Nitrososphaeraceae archaeon]
MTEVVQDKGATSHDVSWRPIRCMRVSTLYPTRCNIPIMGTNTNYSLRLVAVAVFAVLAFAVAGLASWTFLIESSVAAQNDTVVNETMLYTNQTEMAPETKR